MPRLSRAPTHSLAFAGNEDKRVKDPQCIRCGKCINACPMHLLPIYTNVYGKREDLDNAVDCGMMDCIEVRLLRLRLPGSYPAGCTVPSDQGKIQAKRAAERAKAEAEKKRPRRRLLQRQRLKSPQRTSKEEERNGL